MVKWYEDESYWDAVKEAMFDEKRWNSARSEIDQILQLVNIPPGSKILDLGCGLGRHSLELSRRGYKVTGIDLCTSYLSEARKKAASENLDIEFIQGNILDFKRVGSFDLIISLFTSFGYFEDMSDNLKIIKNAHDSLIPGGKILIDVVGKEVLARDFKEKDWYDGRDTLVLEQREIISNWTAIKNKWIIIKNMELKEFSVLLQIYSAFELITILKSQGFSDIKSFGDFCGSKYDQHAKRLIAIGNKAKV